VDNDFQGALKNKKNKLQEPPILMPPVEGINVDLVLDSPQGV
jgi:hypothetical protein